MTSFVPPRASPPWRLIVALSVLGVLLLCTMATYLFRQRDLTESHGRATLAGVANMKSELVEAWIRECFSEAEDIRASFAPFQSVLILPRELSEPEQRVFKNWSSRKMPDLDADLICLTDPEGNVRTSSTATNDPLPDLVKEEIVESAKDGVVRVVDTPFDTNGFMATLFLVTPLIEDASPGGSVIGVVATRLDASRGLLSRISVWTSDSNSAETVLYSRRGDQIFPLSPLRFGKFEPVRSQFTSSTGTLPIVRAFRGEMGFIDGKDYRGVDVLTFTRPVLGSDWVLMAKMDRSEINGPLFEAGLMSFLLIVLFLLMSGFAVTSVWKSEYADMLRRLHESEHAAHLLSNHLTHLREHANDLILLIDAEGRILDANRRASEIYGFSQEELLSMSVQQLREDQSDVESKRIALLLEESKGLVYEVLHQKKNGELIPVEFSTARLEIDGKVMYLGIGRDLTDKRKAEKEIREQQELLQAIIDHAPVMITCCSSDGRMLWVNHLVTDLFGEVKVDSDLNDLFLPYYPDENIRRKVVEGILRADGSWRDAETRCPDGSVVATSWSNIRLADGAIIGIGLDITAREEAEKALRRSEEQFRAIFEHAPLGVALVSVDGIVREANPALLRILGYSREQLLGLHFELFTHPEDLNADVVLSHQLAAGAIDDYELEKRYITPAGEIVWARLHGASVRNEAGEIEYLIGLVEDITEAKRAAESLRTSERRFRAIVDNAAVGVAMATPDGTMIEVNAEFATMLGYTPEELRGRSYKDFTYPEDLEASVTGVARIHASEVDKYQLVKRYVRKDGSWFWVRLTVSSLRNEAGEMQNLIAFAEDISEQRAAEADLRRLATAIEQVNEAIVITDPDGVIQFVNPAFVATTGFTREEVVGHTPRVLKSGFHDTEFYQKLWSTIKSGSTWSGRLVNRAKDDSTYIEDATISPIHGESGEITNFVAVKRNITHEVETERQIRQMQKMDAVGQLAGGIAHDFNNVLQIVLAYSEFVQNELPEGSRQREDLGLVLNAGKRGADLTRQLLAFSRQSELVIASFDVRPLVKEAIKMLRRTIPASVDLQYEFSKNLREVIADATQVHQVLLNLCVNAKDALPQGGRVKVRASMVTIGVEERMQLAADAVEGEFVVIEVSDNGTGISPEVQERIFEPFFTTKDPGRGTGLGLASVYGIVKQHGGFLTFESELGVGTTFKVFLPAGEPSANPDSSSEFNPDKIHGTEHILVVDDEEEIRKSTERGLTLLGYQVTTARSGREAWEILSQPESGIQLVVMDHQMPEMDGEVCLNKVRSSGSLVPVIIASGYIDPDLRERLAASGVSRTFFKPFVLRELAGAIREILEEGEPT